MNPSGQRLHTGEGSRAEWLAALNLMEDALAATRETERVNAALRASEERNVFLLTLSDALRPLSDATAIQEVASRVLGQHLNANRVGYTEQQGKDGQMTIGPHYTDSVPPFKGVHSPSQGAALPVALEAGQIVVYPNVEHEPALTVEDKRALDALDIGAMVNLPLVKGGQLVAILFAHQKTPRVWTEREIRLMQETADRTWAAVEQARAEMALRESEAKLAIELADTQQLQRISSSLIKEDNIAALYSQILDAARSLMRSDMASLQVLSPERNELFLLAQQGFAPESAKFWEWIHSWETSSVGLALARGERVIIPDVELWELVVGTTDLMHYRLSGIRAMQSTPLTSRSGHFVGMISTHWRKVHQPSDRELRLLEVLARQAADLIERRMGEEALRQSEERYRTLFESIDDGFCLFELIYDEKGKAVDYRFLEVNRAFERQTGLAGAVGNLSSEIAPDMESYWFEAYDEVAQTGQPKRFEHFHRSTGRWYLTYASRVGGPGSRQICTVFSDVTERRLNDAALRETQERQGFLLKLSDALRPLGDPVTIQAVAARMLGRHLGISSVAYSEVEPDEDAFTIRGEYSDGRTPSLAGWRSRLSDHGPGYAPVLRAGETIAFSDIRFDPKAHPGGSKESAAMAMVAGAAVPLIKNGRLVAIFSFTHREPRLWRETELQLLREVAERTWAAAERSRAEEALRDSEEKYRELFQSINQGFCTVEILCDESGNPVDYRFLVVNPAYERLTGLKDVVGRRLSEVIPAHLDEWPRIYGEIALTGQPRRFERFAEGLERTFEIFAWRLGQPAQRRVAILFNDVTERQRAAHALRESEEKFRTLASTAPALIWHNDADGNNRFINQYFLDYTGKTAEEISGVGWHTLIHPDQVQAYIADYLEAVRGQRAWQNRNRVRRHDGEWHWFENYAQPLFGRDGTFLGHVGVSTDVNAIIAAEAALRESEHRLRALASNLPGGAAFVIDREFRYILAGGEALTSAGFQSTDFIGRVVTDVLGPELAVEYQLNYERALAGHSFSAEHEAHGHVYLTRGGPLFDREGQVVAALAVSYDITERKRAEEALRESETRLRTLADSVPQIIWANSADGVANYFNRRWYDYTGLSFDQSMGPGWQAIVHPEDAPQSTEAWQRTLAAGEIFDCEYRLRGANGSYRWFIGRNVPLKDESGRVMGWFGSATDIHDLKQAQAQLQEADRRKNHFLAMLGHELRNPLAAIRSGVMLLRSEKAKPASRIAALPVVAEQAAHMERLVDDLLDLSRIVEGRVQVQRKRMALQDAIEQALGMIRDEAEAQNFVIDVRLEKAPLQILGDHVRLTQVFVNILSNAMKYSGTARRIEILATSDGAEAVVRVRDYGQGISADLLPRVFEPFVQATPGMTLQAGLGLGLAVVRQLVRLHDGEAEAFSGGEHKGSEFVIRLPLTASSHTYENSPR